MAVRFANEPLTDALWAETLPLLREHWREVAHYPDVPLDPDRDFYRSAESIGLLRVFTARADDGFSGTDRLVGYAVYFVKPNPHYKTSLQASQDVIYLDPSVRGGTGYKFIAWCDQQLASEGVQAVYQHIKAAHNFGKLLERQGYELVDLIYAKRLDVRRVDRPSVQELLDEAFV